MGAALVVGLIAVMGGAIAYVGDTLGWRMGKRRLSFFGLRPRHTAAVFTVATGMLIAAVTVGVLMLASAGVRIAVTRGEQLLYDNHRLKQERRALEALGRELTLQKDALERANEELSLRNRMLRADERHLLRETGGLQKRNQALQSKNTTLTQRNDQLTREDQRLSARNRTLAGENHQLIAANSRIEGANRRLASANAHLQARNRGLQIAKAGLEKARDLAQTQLTNIQGSLIRTQAKLTHTQADLTRAQANLKQFNDSALRVAEDMRSRSERGQELANGIVVVHAGEELARRVIPPGEPADEVRGALEELLHDAQAEVNRRVSLLHEPVRPVRLNPRGGSSEHVMEQTVTAVMTESHPIGGRLPMTPMPEIHPLVVRALASENEAAESGHPVEVDIGGQVNRLAFRRGEEVASLPLNTASTSGQLLENLVSFLQGPVRKAAMDRSILPDATGSVGKIDYESLLEVIGKVKRMPGQVTVGAIAKAETWTAGPLRLDFYVVPADTRVAAEQKRK